MEAYVISEVLCVLKNNFGKQRADLFVVFVDFFNEAEIAKTKEILMSFAENLNPKPEGIKKITKRVGEARGRSTHGKKNVFSSWRRIL